MKGEIQSKKNERGNKIFSFIKRGKKFEGMKRCTGRVLWLRPKLMNRVSPVDNKIPLPISRKPVFDQKHTHQHSYEQTPKLLTL